MKDELIQVGAEVLKSDEAIFTWNSNGKLHGIISTQVDFLWGGITLWKGLGYVSTSGTIIWRLKYYIKETYSKLLSK